MGCFSRLILKPPRLLGWLAGVWLIGVVAGCGRQEIRVYDVPKEPVTIRPALPEGWQELPGDQMKVGNFAVEGKDGGKAEVTIVPLPGAAGGELENVNRWRRQVSLQPITADELTKEAKEVEVAGAPARFFEMSGLDAQTKGKTRLLAALQPHAGLMWFFKMKGDDDFVRQQKDVFLAFFAKYQYPDAAAGAGEAAPPQIASQIPRAEPPRRSFKPAPGWQPQQPGPMQDAKFLVADGKATVAVSIFAGPTGGVLANVNRWRTQQLGLSAVDEAGLAPLLTSLDLPDTKAKLVDMKGPEQRMVAAIVPRGAEMWFFKLLGEEAAVGAEKKAFIEFVKSAR